MRTPRTAAATLLVLCALASPTSVARADEPATAPSGAPVTRADHVTVASDSGAEVDVLANDLDPDSPTNENLEICRVDPSGDQPFDVFPSIGYDESDFESGFETDVEPGGHPVLTVYPFEVQPGTYTFTYYVCDYDYLSPATLTVKVIGRQNPYADVLTDRPGFVRFHNPGKRRTVIQYGSKDGRTVDGRFALAPRTARTVRIERRAIQWTATIRTRYGTSTSGSLLTGIKQPARQDRTAPASPAARTQADRTAWRLGTRQIELRSRPTSTRRAAGTASAGGTVSRDESTDAPLTTPDTANVSQGWISLADVLDNDSDPDGASNDLGICRASAPAGSGLHVSPIAGDSFSIVTLGRGAAPRAATGDADDPVPYTLLVQADQDAKRGTYDVTYYACDHQYLTPETVTVTVTRSQAVTAHKVKNRRGVVRFTNPGPYDARVQVSSWDGFDFSGQRPKVIARLKLRANTSMNIRPHARRIAWSAFSRRGPGGFGIIGGIGRTPRG